ncbi:hypothetical protein KVT40_003299 [Elsinoe batatas]|uniref:Alcohol dehydrogenase-like N-terminal domain-containing protein n=1 Tax=Elsinoe batatas TaxID=2601811 RepID=A0A8K0L4A0_9PEZI|nr:hypothetical protein KVT40_003299 [Elsinoe batatas]
MCFISNDAGRYSMTVIIRAFPSYSPRKNHIIHHDLFDTNRSIRNFPTCPPLPPPPTDPLPTHRRALRLTSSPSPDGPLTELITEPLPRLAPTSVLIKIHCASLNYRDANIAHRSNPWPVIPNVILGNDAAGSVIAVGEKVSLLKVGDRVAPVNDTGNLTGREKGRSWLGADEDGVLADYVLFDERVVSKLPEGLGWREASVVPCAGT